MKKELLNKTPLALAHWHGDEIALLHLVKKYKIATITSTSNDGEMMDKLFHFLGGKTSRGSSTRGAVQALKGLCRLIKSGRNCSFAVDGPKGPIYKAKPGVFEVSRLMGCPIFVGGVFCDKYVLFNKSWNQTYLPKPFAKIVVVWRGPIGPISKNQDPRSQDLALYLENELRAAKQQALKIIATDNAGC